MTISLASTDQTTVNAPAEVLPQNASITTPTELSMPAYRAEQFRQRAVARMHQGISTGQEPKDIAAFIAADNKAVAAAITDPAFIEAAQKAYLEIQQQLMPNARYATNPTLLPDYMQQFMSRRAAESLGNAERILKEFETFANTPVPTNDQPIVPSLHDVKINEVLEDLLKRDENQAPQVIAHVESTAKGILLEHDALALLFNPDGPLHIPLMAALQKQLPNASNDYIHQMTLMWLRDRQEAAEKTTELAAPEGAARLEAQRQSKAWHEAHRPVAANDNPAPTVTTPAIAQGPLKAAPEAGQVLSQNV